MKPFNLELAKAGHPIVTRSGSKVEFIAHVPHADASENNVVCVSEGQIHLFKENGRFFSVSKDDSYWDLFMVPRTKTVWVNLYPKGRLGSEYYDTQEKADSVAFDYPTRIGGKAYPIEIEE
jgi:hypothetical protein